jgi:hypothetical protein
MAVQHANSHFSRTLEKGMTSFRIFRTRAETAARFSANFAEERSDDPEMQQASDGVKTSPEREQSAD